MTKVLEGAPHGGLHETAEASRFASLRGGSPPGHDEAPSFWGILAPCTYSAPCEGLSPKPQNRCVQLVNSEPLKTALLCSCEHRSDRCTRLCRAQIGTSSRGNWHNGFVGNFFGIFEATTNGGYQAMLKPIETNNTVIELSAKASSADPSPFVSCDPKSI
jgi:hypothetical protein